MSQLAAKNLDPEVVLPSLKWKVPVGFIMLLLGSIGLESTQLQNVGQRLPGQAGGYSVAVLGWDSKHYRRGANHVLDGGDGLFRV
ncbi:hypothetical protein OURE66S_01542 [Oligella ureolytica]